MTITVTMRPDATAQPVSARAVHEMWIALVIEGFTVREVTDRLAVRVDVEAPSEEAARALVGDAYSRGLPLHLTPVVPAAG